MRRVHSAHRIACRASGRSNQSAVRTATCRTGKELRNGKEGHRHAAGSQRATGRGVGCGSPKQQQEVAQAVQDGIAKQLIGERRKIAEQESARARQQVEDELKAEREAAHLQNERIQSLTRKLTLAQQAESGLLKKQQALEDKERELDLNLQQGVKPTLHRCHQGQSVRLFCGDSGPSDPGRRTSEFQKGRLSKNL